MVRHAGQPRPPVEGHGVVQGDDGEPGGRAPEEDVVEELPGSVAEVSERVERVVPRGQQLVRLPLPQPGLLHRVAQVLHQRVVIRTCGHMHKRMTITLSSLIA